MLGPAAVHLCLACGRNAPSGTAAAELCLGTCCCELADLCLEPVAVGAVRLCLGPAAVHLGPAAEMHFLAVEPAAASLCLEPVPAPPHPELVAVRLCLGPVHLAKQEELAQRALLAEQAAVVLEAPAALQLQLAHQLPFARSIPLICCLCAQNANQATNGSPLSLEGPQASSNSSPGRACRRH